MEEKTIFTALNSYCDEKTLEAIFAACRGREDLPDCTIQKLAEEYSVATTLSMENIHSNSELSYDYVRTGILSEDVNTAIESLAFCLGRRDVPADIIASALEMRDDRLTRLAYAVCDGTDLPIATICEWAQSQIVFQIAALHACRRFQEIRPEIVKDACEAFASLEDKKLCDDLVHKMDINEEYLTEWLLSSDQNLWRTAAKACLGLTNPSVEFIERGLEHSDSSVRNAMFELCTRIDLSNIVFTRWLRRANQFFTAAMATRFLKNNTAGFLTEMGMLSENPETRLFAVWSASNTCPPDVVERWLRSPNILFQKAGLKACIGNDGVRDSLIREYMDKWPINSSLWELAAICLEKKTGKPVRTFEPRGVVFKRCLNGVLVTARIPSDASIRGAWLDCHSDKAVIESVGGDFFGEDVGVTFEGPDLQEYRAEDVIAMDNFWRISQKERRSFSFSCHV
ncbi:hypothetical protein IKE19_02645 [Candidatus Saccharibacteria bacterium]|nr:hypothetical protein [Candidatus Saccharibacteria bacterium]